MRNISFLPLCMICALLLTGCSSVTETHDTTNARATVRHGITRTYNRSDLDSQTSSSNERAKKIANAIASLEEIDKASVVISGNTAIAGIVVQGEPDEAEILKSKGRVEREIKAADANIDHVAVTAASDLVKRVTSMADSATSVKKSQKYNKELQSVMKKLSI